MHKIALLGDPIIFSGFKAFGFYLYSPNTDDEVRREIRKLAQDGYAIIFISESLYLRAEREIEKYSSLPVPAIIPLPDKSGSTGIGQKNIRKLVELAIGTDIL